VREFWCSGNSPSSSVENKLKTTKRRCSMVKKEKGVAIVESIMTKRGSTRKGSVAM
jgi:hypothetical protein